MTTSFSFDLPSLVSYISDVEKFSMYDNLNTELGRLGNKIRAFKVKVCKNILNGDNVKMWENMEVLNELGCNGAIQLFLEKGRWT